MKKVALIAPGFHPVPPVKGAAVEIWIDEVARRLAAYEPWVFSPWDPQRCEEEMVGPVHHVRIRLGTVYTRLFRKITRLDPFPMERRVARRVAAAAPALIHLHGRYSYLSALRRGSETARLPVIFHVHNKFGTPPGDGTSPRFDVLAGCSRYILDYAGELFSGFRGERVVLPNGVDTRKFRPFWEFSEEVRQLRREVGVEDRKVILYVGRISPEKGIDSLVAAFPRVLHRHPDAALVLIGEIRRDRRGDRQRERYAAEVISRAGLYADRIKFLDWLPPSRIHRYYLLGDLLAAPSLEGEAFGMVFLEAAASGLPVVAARRGGIPEAVQEGRSGVLLDRPEDPEELAAAISTLLDDPRRRRAMGEFGRDWVEREFDWQGVARRVEDLYGGLLGR